MLEKTLEKDLVNFIGMRLQEGSSLAPGLMEDHDRACDVIKDIAKILASEGNSTYGETEQLINGTIYDIIMGTCCRHEENGYLKGFRDGLLLSKKLAI